MSRIVTGFSVSLDGFVAGPNDSPEQPLGEGGEGLFQWYATGDTEFRFPSGTFSVQVSSAAARMLQEAATSAGALVSGRRTFDLTNGWDGRHPLDVPVFVVTHSLPQAWIAERRGQKSSITFVTGGLESALEQAGEVAGGKSIVAGSPSIAKQCLKAGLLDEVQVSLVPLLLGGGVRLFDHLGPEPIELELTRVVHDPDVTHLGYIVLK